MCLHIRIQREPIASKGESPGEIESAKSSAWILGTVLYRSRHVRRAEEAPEEGMKSNRLMVLPAPNDAALKSKFKVGGRFEAHLLDMHPWAVGIHMSLQGADQEFIAKGA